MTVKPYARLTFLVTSESIPEVEWLVDLSKGEGECTCFDFVYRRKKKQNATCKHLRSAKAYLLNEIIAKLKEQETSS